MNMANALKNKKLTLFLDYFDEKLTKNQNIPIVIWNVSKHQHTTNSAVEGWNSELNSIIGKQQPIAFLLVKRLIGETECLSWQLKSKEPGQPSQKRRKAYV